MRAPLNAILGTEANVRILRVLAGSDAPLSRSRLAEQTMLHISGIARAISMLEEQGIVKPIGSGARQPVQFRGEHPLGHAIRALFHAEQERYNAFIGALVKAAKLVTPPPLSVWIEGPVVHGTDRLHDDVVVGVLARAQELDTMVSTLEDAIVDLQSALDVTVEVRGRTISDITASGDEELEALRNVVPLLGAPPLAVIGSDGVPEARRVAEKHSHQDLDAQSRELAAAVAERIRDDPGIVSRARAYLAARIESASSGEQRELREWDRILRTMSLPRLRRFLVDEGQRATRLRQTSPFAGVLTAEERRNLESAVRKQS